METAGEITFVVNKAGVSELKENIGKNLLTSHKANGSKGMLSFNIAKMRINCAIYLRMSIFRGNTCIFFRYHTGMGHFFQSFVPGL